MGEAFSETEGCVLQVLREDEMREFWLVEWESMMSGTRISISNEKEENAFKVREVNPELDAAYEEMEVALKRLTGLCAHGQNDYSHKHCSLPADEALAALKKARNQE